MRQISTPFSPISRCRAPQAVQLTAAGKLVGKGYNGAPHTQQAVAGLRPGDMAHLGAGDIQELGNFGPIRGCLIQEDQKLTVGKHQAGGFRAQAFLHILGGAGHSGGILAKPLPALIEELRGVKILEKQVDFINKDPGVLSSQTV